MSAKYGVAARTVASKDSYKCILSGSTKKILSKPVYAKSKSSTLRFVISMVQRTLIAQLLENLYSGKDRVTDSEVMGE
jgi:hypothetical protein